VPVITIRVMGRTNMLKTEGLMLKSVCMSHMGAGSQAELSIVCVSMVWMKGTEAMHGIGPRSHKAFKAKGFRGKAQKDNRWAGMISGNSDTRVGEGGGISHISGVE
jgi:hypothetical protein